MAAGAHLHAAKALVAHDESRCFQCELVQPGDRYTTVAHLWAGLPFLPEVGYSCGFYAKWG
jgi:hypothetical protein